MDSEDPALKLAYVVGAPGIPVQGPSGASAHVRGLAQAWESQHELRLYAALREDRRGSFGPQVPSISTGVSGWPSWLSRYREMREVLASRRLCRQLIQDITGVGNRMSSLSDTRSSQTSAGMSTTDLTFSVFWK